MLQPIIKEVNKSVAFIVSQLDEQAIETPTHRSQKVVDGQVEFQVMQQMTFEPKQSGHEDETLMVLSLTLEHFIKRLEPEFEGFDNQEQVRDILQRNKTLMLANLQRHVDKFQRMRLNVDHVFILMTYFNSTDLKEFVLFVTERHGSELGNLVFGDKYRFKDS